MNRILRAIVTSLVLVVAACGGSSDPQPATPSTTTSTAISESEAIAAAKAVAAEQGLSVEGLDVKPGQLFGEWQVSFEPTDSGSLTGGFLVVLDAQTGDLIEVVEYR